MPPRLPSGAEKHFVNIARYVHTMSEWPALSKCLFTAVATDLEVLQTSNHDATKLASLKFLVTWLGEATTPARLVRA